MVARRESDRLVGRGAGGENTLIVRRRRTFTPTPGSADGSVPLRRRQVTCYFLMMLLSMSFIRNAFQRLHYPVDIIAQCVRWYLAYALSLRNHNRHI